MCESGRTNTRMKGTQLRPEGRCGGAEITDRVSGGRQRPYIDPLNAWGGLGAFTSTFVDCRRLPLPGANAATGGDETKGKTPKRRKRGPKLGYLCTHRCDHSSPGSGGRESDEGRLRADWTSHPGAWMGVGRRVRLSFLTAPEVKVDFSFRP